MSAVGDAISAIRDALRLSDEVKRVGETLAGVAVELRDHRKAREAPSFRAGRDRAERGAFLAVSRSRTSIIKCET